MSTVEVPVEILKNLLIVLEGYCSKGIPGKELTALGQIRDRSLVILEEFEKLQQQPKHENSKKETRVTKTSETKTDD